ncbi:MAG: SDR family oxidoreductase [Sinobacteraceae bacterium]|nr:SDR family oxidoreductase [Nevskiaceae bacterium]
MSKSVVVTGVSSGIGQATATLLVGLGWQVFGSVRRAQDAERLQGSLGPAFTPLLFDVTDESAVRSAARTVCAALGERTLDGLVNNAGIAVAGPLTHLPVAEFRRQLEVNLVGPMIVTQAFLPLLGSDPARRGPKGRIVNLSSVGGRLAMPFLAPYCVSKFGLEAFSESLRRELMYYGIDVVIVAPGHVATPIWDKAEEVDIAPYESLPIAGPMKKFRDYFITEGRKGFPPERIAAAIHTALTAARPKARYALVPGRFANWTLPRLMPARTLDRLIAARLGLRSKRG